MLKKILFLSILLSGIQGLAAPIVPTIPTVSIDCSNGTCTPNFPVKSNFSRNTYTAIDADQQISNINVTTDSLASPYSLRMNVLYGQYPDGTVNNPGYNLNVNLSSTTKNAPAGSLVLVGDNFNDLSISLNGYNGAKGLDASVICANNIKNSLYGADTLSFFNNLRINNPSLPSNQCVLDDYNYLQNNKFQCDSGFTPVLTTNSVFSVNVQDIPKIPRCQTSLSYDTCLQRKTQISCQWTIVNGSFSLTGDVTTGSNTVLNTSSLTNIAAGQIISGLGITDNTTIQSISGNTITLSTLATATVTSVSFTATTPTNYGTTIIRIVPENEYFFFKGLLSNSDMCNLHVAEEVSDPSYVPQGLTTTFSGDLGNNANQVLNANTFLGSVTVGSTQLNFNTIPSYVAVGQSIVGTGILPGATIVSINTGLNNLIISNPATITANNEDILTGISTGEAVFGPGIPSSTQVASIAPGVITLTNFSILAAPASSFSAFSQSGIVNPLTANANNYAGCTGTCTWKETQLTTNLTTPGMIGNQLAPGSNWVLNNTLPGQHCDSSNNTQTGFYSTFQSTTLNYVAYDNTDTTCKASDIVTYAGGVVSNAYPAQSIDPNKTATWFYTGVGQEPDFGTQVVECDLGNCPVDSQVSDLTQQLDKISPQNGENGTQQGNGLVLIYDALNLSPPSAQIGIAGAGGRNDIVNQSSSKVCVKVSDAVSGGITSAFALNPLVIFNRYTWTALQTSASGNPGQQPVNNGNAVTIWKKLDSSVRALIQNELFNQ